MPTLYEQLGGAPAVNKAVDIFYDKLLADDRVKHFFNGVDMPKQIGKQKIFLAYAFGGPVNYTGKDMRAAHKHLDINEEHFGAVAEHLAATLKELDVPQDQIDQVLAIAGSTHDDVLDL